MQPARPGLPGRATPVLKLVGHRTACWTIGDETGLWRSRLVSEHQRCRGDPAIGGSTPQPIMTACRQQAMACAAALPKGPVRPRTPKLIAPDAPKILRSNVYGWFDRVERGVHVLTESGRQALTRWPILLACEAVKAAEGASAERYFGDVARHRRPMWESWMSLALKAARHSFWKQHGA